MDTVIEVKLAADTPDSSAIFGKCRNIIAEYEKMLSAEDGDSDIARFNMSESGCKVSLATGELFLLAQELYRLTDGRFDPTTYPSTLLWRSAGQLGELPESNEIEVAAQKRGMELISYDPSDRMLRKLEPWVMLDFGGIGKGYAEPALAEDASGIAVQFERTGYYFKDKDSTDAHIIFNKTVALKDSYKPE